MRKAQNYQWKELSLGTCYYPEHWDRNLWKEDLDRMQENGIHTIRIGEFAWSKVEPREGEFTFAFFDDFLEVVAQTEMERTVPGDLLLSRALGQKPVEGRSGPNAGKWYPYNSYWRVCMEQSGTQRRGVYLCIF